MPIENENIYLDGLIVARQCIETIAKQIFVQCPVCEEILSYLTPQELEKTRYKTRTEIEAEIGSNYKEPFDALVSAGFLNKPCDDAYGLTEMGCNIAVYAKLRLKD
ncbi:MAG: hypothetical protein KAJ24_05760 [Candidatus Aenigmarchaeota archaeon]|nr:hypothetical protein [Candidatus Aenigmarchaeota archaeon]